MRAGTAERAHGAHARAQKYEGDLTIVPEFDLRDVLQLLANPTEQRIQSTIRRGARCPHAAATSLLNSPRLAGRRNTWQYITWIRMHCLVEFTLDEAVRCLRARLVAMGRQREQSGLQRIVSFHTSRSTLNLVRIAVLRLVPLAARLVPLAA